MFENLLIKNVRMHACLYDRDFTFYTSKDARISAWLKVAIGTKQSVKKCKDRWRSLRNHFVREVQKVDELGGEHMYTNGRWRHYDAMLFLKPHIHVLRKVFTIQKSVDEKGETNLSDTEHMRIDEDTQDSFEEDRNHSYDSDFQQDSTVSIETRYSPKTSKSRQATKAKSARKSSSSPSVAIEPQFDFMLVDSLNNTDNAELSLGEDDSPRSTPAKEVNEGDESHCKEQHHCIVNERLETSLKAILATLTQKIPTTEETNPNAGFLSMLDGYLKQLPEDLRESMKMKILNCVYNKIRELKNLKIIK